MHRVRTRSNDDKKKTRLEERLAEVKNGAAITADYTEADMEALRTEEAALERDTPASLVEATSDQEALGEGRTLSASRKRSDGMIEEMTVGVIDVPYATFIQRAVPAEWGKNLYGHVGGQVNVKEVDDQGRPVRQAERMVLETPMSHYLSWLGQVAPLTKHLDMTKTEEIDYGADSAKVRWRVYLSDNQTVKQDIGSVRFEAEGNKTKVTFHSAHIYFESYTAPMNWGPLAQIRDAITAKNLRDYFTAAIDHYRAIAGER